MSDDLKFATIMVGVIAAGFLLFTAALFFIKSAACEQRWEGSGMASQFALFAGCRIQVEPGKWIPDDRYRELPE